MPHDQCPSSKGKHPAAVASRVGKPNGTPAWRSVEEFSQTDAFREIVEREFPAGASELAGESRRDFVKLMGASLALAGAATVPGCRRPDHKILPYSKDAPEEIIPGKPLFYATSMPRPGGGAEGLLVETHEGRPTKVEGNPLHPNNRGRCSAQAISSVLRIYDPDRLHGVTYDNPVRGLVPATWDDFKHWGESHFAGLESDGGARLAVIAEPRSAPTWNAAKDAFRQRFPSAQWVTYSPAGSDVFNEGSTIAFGKPMREVFNLSRARVIVALDRDLTEHDPGAIANSREIGANRRVWRSDEGMSRIYAIEPMHSALGTLADHHLALAPSRISAFAVALAKEILARRDIAGLRAAMAGVQVPDAESFDDIPVVTEGRTFIQLLADDLLDPANRSHSVIAAGASQPAAVHALVHALNAALGNAGSTVTYVEQRGDLGSPAAAGLESLVNALANGQIDTVVCLGVNPVYDAPAGSGFAAAYEKVANRVCLTVGATETADASTWRLNAAHWLESWGDTESADGTVAPTQPMIAPLYEPAMSELEFLGYLGGEDEPDGHDMVRAAWARTMGFRPNDGEFENLWRRALHDGVVANSAAETETPAPRGAEIGAAVGSMAMSSGPTESALDVVFTTGPVGDGRDANVSWLQEMPHPITKVVWDNPVVVSPATARALNVTPDSYTSKQEPKARMATLSIGGRSMKLPVWICPGMADNTAVVTLGYGRTTSGHIGTGVGFNTYELLGGARDGAAVGGALARVGETYPISSTQNHWALEGRTSIARWLDKPAWQEHAHHAEESETGGRVEDPFDTSGDDSALSLAEQLGELSHTPANLSLYENPYNAGRGNAQPGSVYATHQQWGMTIDMASCTGCGACTIACQSENNIPVVGKKEVAKGREMHWIRVDRYFVGDSLESPERVMNQPVACTQCENAPCETVCPVTATVHDREGLNVMAYNRCIGTRYCMNNCPYKARRFNFFDWGQAKTNGGFDPTYVPESIRNSAGGAEGPSFNQNLIPPRLRAKLDEVQKMKHNPDVTVRGRGVMEKCTYCIQRINASRADAKVQGLDSIPDGFFQVACQQACPSESIVFGDITDPESAVSRTRTSQRSYMLLGYINTRPRTSHLMRITNPNPAITAPVDGIAAAHGHHGDDHGGHGHGEGGDSHGDDGHGDEHSFRVDPRRGFEDDGYALSLRVLGSVNGVQA